MDPPRGRRIQLAAGLRRHLPRQSMEARARLIASLAFPFLCGSYSLDQSVFGFEGSHAFASSGRGSTTSMVSEVRRFNFA